jgi:ATP phosphoribosyltransferase
MFRRAGFNIVVGPRAYYPHIDDPELDAVLLRAQEIAGYVQDGVLDLGLTGLDWILEQGADVQEVEDLVYAKQGLRPYRWVLAVPESSSIHSVQDLQGKRIATEIVHVAEKWLAENGVEAHVEYSWGATEAKCPDLVDAIIEGTETGSTLRAHNLRIVTELFQSTTRLIANKTAWQDPWKRDKAESIAMLLRGALAAEGMVGLKMNVRRADLDQIVEALPALKNPTISSLSDPEWVAVETITDQKTVRVLIPDLKRRGAQGIIEYPLNKVIP